MRSSVACCSSSCTGSDEYKIAPDEDDEDTRGSGANSRNSLSLVLRQSSSFSLSVSEMGVFRTSSTFIESGSIMALTLLSIKFL